jgi:hypothetical protein
MAARIDESSFARIWGVYVTKTDRFMVSGRSPQSLDFAYCAAHNSSDPFVTRNPVMDNGLFASITPHLDGGWLGSR